MISVHFQGKPFNITVIQVYVPTSNTEEAEVERFYDFPLNQCWNELLLSGIYRIPMGKVKPFKK